MTTPVDVAKVALRKDVGATGLSTATSATVKTFVSKTRSPSTSGTAQTLLIVGDAATAAEAATTIARALQRDLVRVPISGFVGEAGKHLDRVLATAPSGDAVLFFDEADALFGKRTDVKNGHDRYANAEIGTLLQRLESRRGVAVVATRYKPNLDSAFTRRFASIAYVDPPR